MTDQFESSRDNGSPAPSSVPVDRVRIDELARAIEAGHYIIDVELIATKLIDGGFPYKVNSE